MDRSDSRNQLKEGGGVATLIKNNIICERIILPEEIAVQYICLKIQHMNRKIILINVYLPIKFKRNSVNELRDLFIFIKNNLNHYDIVMTGDFNMPGITWIPDPDLDGCFTVANSLSGHESLFADLVFNNGLFQIHEPRQHSII